MEIVEYLNVIKVMRRDITYLSDDLLHIAKQFESINEFDFINIDSNNTVLVESMRNLSKMILDYDNNVLEKYEWITTEHENF